MKIYNRLTLGGAKITLEESQRRSKCSRCGRYIPPHHQRVNFTAPNATPIPQRKGGSIFEKTLMFHPECFTAYFSPNDGIYMQRCWDCAAGVEKAIHFGWVRTGRSVWSHVLCNKCVSSGRWRWCSICHQYGLRAETSPIIEEGVIVDRFLCDTCQYDSNIFTVKQQKQLKRAG